MPKKTLLLSFLIGFVIGNIGLYVYQRWESSKPTPAPGEPYESADGCNTCTNLGSSVTCTAALCVSKP
jgi:hypothetical protein